MDKILLYYKYVEIKDPKELAIRQRALCEKLSIKGRILIGDEGINGTIGGTEKAIDEYKKVMLADSRFSDMDIKESYGTSDDFPKLKVKVRKEIVAFGKNVSPNNAGQYLSPDEIHELLNNKSDDLVVIDCRNDYESRVGHFRDAIKPPVRNFREFPKYIDENIEHLKDKKVFMYCTGGIRCEKATAYAKQQGIKDVYHAKGGIHRYVEKYPDGHFRGKNYVFDDRIAVTINDDITDNCDLCEKPYEVITNCRNTLCNKQFIACKACVKELNTCCGKKCFTLIEQGKVKARTNYRTGSICNL